MESLACHPGLTEIGCVYVRSFQRNLRRVQSAKKTSQ